MNKFLILGILIITALSGCSATFDKQGNFNARAAQLEDQSVSQLSSETAIHIHERSLQLWRPKDLEKGHSTTLVSQAALVSPDGYALAATHALTSGQVFTFHAKDASSNLLRVNHWDPDGIHHVNADGTERILTSAQFIPIREIHRFQDSDITLIQVRVEESKFFELSSSPPTEGHSLSYGYNPIIHRDLRGWSGKVTHLEATTPSTWKIKCNGAAIFGDSGGPVINESGQLVGNITGASVGILYLGKAKRVINIDLERVSTEKVKQAIEKDRRRPQNK
jgi:hypothetical protein